jgi:hypothetical protein
MTDRYTTLKAWCKWKREGWANNYREDDDHGEDFVKELEDLISEVGTLKARLANGSCQHSVHGSAPCLNCKTGSITIFAKSRWCIDCQQKNPRWRG